MVELENIYVLLFNGKNEQLIVLDKKYIEAQEDPNRLFEIETPFPSPQTIIVATTGS